MNRTQSTTDGDAAAIRKAKRSARAAMTSISVELRRQGHSLDDLMEAGRRARAKIADEKYGATKPDTPARRPR